MSAPLTDDSIRHLQAVIDEPDLAGTKYSLVRRIAAGGMSTVYLVEDKELKRNAALKLLSVPGANADLLARMLREAETIASLEHPGIIPIHDIGRLPDGRFFYVMKFVDGLPLHEAVRQTGDLKESLRIFLRACEAVAFAHSRGVLHRDLKPANIMVGPFGEVLVMDWGLAKLLNETNPVEPAGTLPAERALGDTTAGTAIGTPGFMPPEQERGDGSQVDERSDVFALGSTLRAMLAELGGTSPRPLAAICGRAAHPERERRYEDVAALAADIQRYLDELPVSAYRENVFEKLGRWVSRNRFVVILVLAYMIVRLLVFLLSQR